MQLTAGADLNLCLHNWNKIKPATVLQMISLQAKFQGNQNSLEMQRQ